MSGRSVGMKGDRAYRVLGSLEVLVDGAVVDLGGPKQRAVLARLLIDANRVVSLDRLIEDLWGDSPPVTAAATLQAYISNLRRILEPDRAARTAATVLVSRPPGYVMEVGAGELDSIRFEKLVTAGMAAGRDDPGEGRRLIAEALDLWRGPAYSDLTYETFAIAEISRLEELRTAATEERIGADLSMGRSGDLVAELEHLVAAHPLRERLWNQLMLALYRSGRQAEALRAYRRHADLLVEELGIDPSAELRRLEQAMLDQDPSLLVTATEPADPHPTPAAPAASPAVGPSPVTPALEVGSEPFLIVGRRAELDRFGGILAEAERGRGAIVLVEGEPGIGKSRLLEAMQHGAFATGVPAVIARCVEVGRTPAFWPWVQTSRGLMAIFGVDALTRSAGPYAATLAPWFPDLRPHPDRPPAAPDLAPHAVAEGVLYGLRQLTADRPLVILIDDLYAADPDSLAVLTLIGAEIGRLGLVLVGSYRTTDLPTDHPLAEVLAQLSRLDRIVRMPLRRLSVDETGELVRQVTGDVVAETVRTIHHRTEGNAFFTVELARLLSGDGTLTPEALTDVVPTGVKDVIRQRLARLGDDAVRILRVAAVCGRRWDLGVVAEVHGMDLGEALDLVDLVVGSGLVVEDERAGWYRFSHVLIADTVADSLGALRRAGLHHKVGEVLERTRGEDPAAWVEIAHHAVEAVPVTGPETALEPLTRAGRHAVATNAIALGEQLCEERLELVLSMPPTPARDTAEIEVLLDLGTVWTWREGYHSERLARASARILELAGTIEEPEKVNDLVLQAVMGRYSTEIVGGRSQDAMETAAFVDDLAAANPDPYIEMVGHVMNLVTGLHLPDFDRALARVERIEEVIRIIEPDEDGSVLLPLDQQSIVVTYREFYAGVLWMTGDRAAAYEQLARARRIAERSRHPYTIAFAATVEVVVAAYDLNHEQCSSALKWVRQLVDTEDLGVIDAWLTIADEWARLAAATGPVDTALLRSLIASVEDRGALVVIGLYWGTVADLELSSDRPEAALEATERGLAHAAVPGGERFWSAELERLRAEALARLGRDAEAADARRNAEATAEAAGQPYILARIRGTVAPG